MNISIHTGKRMTIVGNLSQIFIVPLIYSTYVRFMHSRSNFLVIIPMYFIILIRIIV